MQVINVRNVNHALPAGIALLQQTGMYRTSRNGSVLVAPGPVATVYTNPLERVLFNSVRNANPFFHFMESLWMLGGREDVAFVAQFNSRMATYSDDGRTFHGAYGNRWRSKFGIDQLDVLVQELSANPDTRRAVLIMWSTYFDLSKLKGGGKDFPCNTHAYFNIDNNHLHMTVCCRSNDIIWGAYGANVVHFSFLQQYLANCLGVEVGTYTQISNNYHLYPEAPNVPELLEEPLTVEDHYTLGVRPHPQLIESSVQWWNMELRKFLENPAQNYDYANTLFGTTAVPMYRAWAAYKAGNEEQSYDYAGFIVHTDWKIACTQWLNRAWAARRAKGML